jgi:acyl-homoserine lactone synthase
MAATVDVRQETLDALRERIGIAPVLRQDGPRLNAIARANICSLATAQRKIA